MESSDGDHLSGDAILGAMPAFGRASRRTSPHVTLLIAVLAVAGCGASATPSPDPVAGSTPAPSPSLAPASASPRPTEAASPTPDASGPVVFESVVYPYTLTMPPGVLTRQWRAARIAWDGQQMFSRTSPNVDANGTADGSLLVWGLAWDGDAAGFGALIDEVGGRYNGCSRTADPAPLEVDGVSGVSFLHACALDTYAVSAALVKDGYGLTFRVVGDAGVHDPAVLERLETWMAGATWPTAG